jgi:hypothetical protein
MSAIKRNVDYSLKVKGKKTFRRVSPTLSLVPFSESESASGMPDFSWYNIGTKMGKTIQDFHQIYQMAVNVPNIHEIYQHFSFQGTPEYIEIEIFGYSDIPSGNPGVHSPGDCDAIYKPLRHSRVTDQGDQMLL